MNIKRGNVVIVDLNEVEETEREKTRPCVVIQNNTGNKHSPTTILTTITSSIGKIYPHEVKISSNEGGLDKDSKIQLDQIYTVQKEHIQKKIGELSERRIEDIDQAIKVSLGLV